MLIFFIHTVMMKIHRWKKPWRRWRKWCGRGKALYVGISNYKPEQTKKAVRILHQLGVHCLIHQPSYSMLNRWIEEELLDVLEERGIGCAVYSPLAQGLLSTKYFGGIPATSRAGRGITSLKPETGYSTEIEADTPAQRNCSSAWTKLVADGIGMGFCGRIACKPPSLGRVR